MAQHSTDRLLKSEEKRPRIKDERKNGPRKEERKKDRKKERRKERKKER